MAFRVPRSTFRVGKGGGLTRIAVVGGGAWGTALADLLARKGAFESVTIWAREPEVVDAINSEHVNHVFLPDAPLEPTLRADADLAGLVREADVVVSSAPSHVVRDVVASVSPALARGALVVSVSKGLDPRRHATISCVLADVLPPTVQLAVVSGPSFAQEVYQHQPTAVVAAARDHAVAERVQRIFSTGYFRVYSHTDVLGVELGGALKNVIALAAGIVEGLGLGHNARAALITRGLAEITRLGVALGAEPATFAGLAGMGDLILTATGLLSRNRSLGVELGRGRRLEEVLAGRTSVAEGVNTARSAVTLAERHGVELPIAREVAELLFKGKSPRQAVADLMERELKAEQWGGGGEGP
jgi:glycerol-3-phosphate dehydrogenase (NAD(P)+)